MLGHWAALLPIQLAHLQSPIDPVALGVWALQYTPRVALLEEAVVAEIDASARLFGGLDVLRSQIQDGAAELGARLAWAPTGTAALALARSRVPDAFEGPLAAILDRLPLHSITAVGRHEPTLARLGCRTIGDVRKLPRGGMARRFDKALLAGLDEAYGLRPEVYEWVTLPETFQARLELMSRVDLAPAMLFSARRLLVQLAGWLAARHMGTTAFTLRWNHDVMRARGTDAGGELTVRTAQPTQNVEHLGRLLGEHLAKVQLQAPASDLELLASEVTPIIEESRSLLPEPRRRGESTELALERIQARLGSESVLRPVSCADHRLEWMQQWQSGKPPRAKRAPDTYELPLPTWVLDEPLRLAVRDNRPMYQGPLQMLLGPDRVEGGWWHRAGQGTEQSELNVQRDYWVACSAHAGILWVFQQRLARDETAWFLHGHFA